MNLSELIARHGDESVKFQKLDDCTSSISTTKHGVKATFVTAEAWDLKGFTKLGLIVWLDRERVAQIIAEDQARPQPAARPSGADLIIAEIEKRFPNWRSFRDLVDCIDVIMAQLREPRR